MSDEHGLAEWMRKATQKEAGGWGERLWSGIFNAAGLNYIRLCNIKDGGAPLQRGKDVAILTDYEVSTNRFSIYADSKWKKGPVFYRNAQQWRHGIDRRVWEHYKAFSELNRKHCCIALFEAFTDEDKPVTWSGALLVQTLTQLGSPFYGFGTQPHMVYWPRDYFDCIGTVSPDEALRYVNYHTDSTPMKEPLWKLLDLLETEAAKPVQMRFF